MWLFESLKWKTWKMKLLLKLLDRMWQLLLKPDMRTLFYSWDPANNWPALTESWLSWPVYAKVLFNQVLFFVQCLKSCCCHFRWILVSLFACSKRQLRDEQDCHSCPTNCTRNGLLTSPKHRTQRFENQKYFSGKWQGNHHGFWTGQCHTKVMRKTSGIWSFFSWKVCLTIFEKSNFCPKFQFWLNPNIFTSFSPKIFLTAKKYKSTTFSRVFQPQKIDNFLGKAKLNFWTKNEDFEHCALGRAENEIRNQII